MNLNSVYSKSDGINVKHKLVNKLIGWVTRLTIAANVIMEKVRKKQLINKKNIPEQYTS